MSYCADCVEKAKLRNRDMDGMIVQARKQVGQESIAICWDMQKGLFLELATTAIINDYTIRDIISGLQ